MKKLFFILAVVCLISVSCTKDQTTAIDGPYEFTGSLDNSEFVDLGLSVKWASCNLGANIPEDSGFRYQWGQINGITGKATLLSYPMYDSATKKYADPYNAAGVVLLPEDDAAAAVKSGRIPTPAEVAELETSCSWLYVRYKGVLGFVVAGTNGNRIFLPACGYLANKGRAKTSESYGLYWTNTLSTAAAAAIGMSFSTKQRGSGQASRYIGAPIRAVQDITN